MIWLAKIYKAWAVNLDQENKAVIKTQEAAEKEPPSDIPETPAIDYEALAEDTKEKARVQAKGVMDNATKESGRILTMARDEAERIKTEARVATEQEKAVILSEAEKRGYNEGYNEGYQKGEAEAQAIIAEAERLKEETQAQREAAIKRFEPELVELIIRIIRKIVADTIKLKPQTVLHLIRQGLAQSSFTGDVTLRVSKEDYDNVLSNKDALLESVEGGADLAIVKDFSLNSGDCVIETPFGVIDSSLDMQFEEIRESLQLILNGESDSGIA